MARQREKYRDIPPAKPEEVEALRLQARKELPERLAVLAERYGFSYNRVAIKHNATNWGSCSSKGNINLNLSILRLPGILRDYVLLHELCHLRHQDHGHSFHLLLEHVLTDHILREADKGDALSKELARKAAVSKARFPLDHTMTRAIREYRVL
ncbi:MAG: M48 family metallopeptidase [Bacteroidales bacterium]|nr:M48 family metallopeptidase [Bacteroidales bacterium]